MFYYDDPFRGLKGRIMGRIDQGVDAGCTEESPVFALGYGVIEQYGLDAAWPGGVKIVVRFTKGRAKGHSYYIAEHLKLRSDLHIGMTVTKRTVLGYLIPGYPNCEIGWCKDNTTTPLAYGCYTEGERTAAGDSMNQFLVLNGCPPGLTEGRPVTCPLPPGWPKDWSKV